LSDVLGHDPRHPILLVPDRLDFCCGQGEGNITEALLQLLISGSVNVGSRCDGSAGFTVLCWLVCAKVAESLAGIGRRQNECIAAAVSNAALYIGHPKRVEAYVDKRVEEVFQASRTMRVYEAYANIVAICDDLLEGAHAPKKRGKS